MGAILTGAAFQAEAEDFASALVVLDTMPRRS